MKVIALSLLLCAGLSSQGRVSRTAQLPGGERIPHRSGVVDCTGFLDHGTKVLHVVCSASNRVLVEVNLSVPPVGETISSRQKSGNDWVEWSLSNATTGSRWQATDNLGQTSSGQF